MGGGSSLLRVKLSMEGRRSFLDLSLVGTVGPCNIWWRGWSGFPALVCRFTQKLFLLMFGGGIPERQEPNAPTTRPTPCAFSIIFTCLSMLLLFFVIKFLCQKQRQIFKFFR